MLETGWVSDARLLAGGGNYCPRCAHLLRIARLAEQCAWCEAPMVEEERAELEGWGYFADALGELASVLPGLPRRALRHHRAGSPPPRPVGADSRRRDPRLRQFGGCADPPEVRKTALSPRRGSSSVRPRHQPLSRSLT